MHTIYFKRSGNGNDLLVDSHRVRDLNSYSPSMDELHTTTFYELFFFNQVEGTLIVEGEKLPLKGPTAVLFPPLTARQWDIQFDDESYLVFFEGEFMESFLKDSAFLHRLHFFSCSLRVPVLPLSENQKQAISPLILALRSELEQHRPDNLYLLQSYLYQLLLHFNRFYTGYHELDPNLNRNSEIIQFRTLLKQHIHNTQTVQAYAEMMGMPRNKMNELCVKVFAKQAHLLIRDELLQACKTDLLSSPMTVAEISYKYNFSAPSNFTRFFKTHTGFTPATYRAQFGD
ncbi:helix-turn-helix domain-containing protein [Mangrovibacterium lignilyticum]|uniref:helix-turn-helix domain-containing protein n=1 Tax=Mangrovibacterium lignilyticum TaxID=2668052 RepID=UPI0013CFB6FB|nr:AraC family transcriptional regulator [Mangrovibacterium lignilyticum]